MNGSPKRVVYLTAGAGGMYCGSCLNDNTLARALTRLGVDVQLVPVYTPIRAEINDVSIDQVFFGGINVFLQQKVPLLRWLPAGWDRILNNPKLIRWATRKDVQADPKLLGQMTVSMLQGTAGFQRKEVGRLLQYLRWQQPDLVNFTNVLIAGCAPEIRRQLGIPIVVTLQGDDIFLDYIPAAARERAVAEVHRLSDSIDAFVVHSEYYSEHMQSSLGIPSHKIQIVRLGIDHTDFEPRRVAHDAGFKTIGYLARLTPEKGFHLAVEAFIRLRTMRDDVRLRIAGWLGTEHRRFAEEQFQKLAAAGLRDQCEYLGEVSRQEKVLFLSGLDLFSVPTVYQEPKGLFALEAMASGIPVVLPAHGAFPELVGETNCGLLVEPGNVWDLAAAWNSLLDDAERCRAMGAAGRDAVLQDRNSDHMAQQTLDLYSCLCQSRVAVSRMH